MNYYLRKKFDFLVTKRNLSKNDFLKFKVAFKNTIYHVENHIIKALTKNKNYAKMWLQFYLRNRVRHFGQQRRRNRMNLNSRYSSHPDDVKHYTTDDMDHVAMAELR